jgi:hypothetical protein
LERTYFNLNLRIRTNSVQHVAEGHTANPSALDSLLSGMALLTTGFVRDGCFIPVPSQKQTVAAFLITDAGSGCWTLVIGIAFESKAHQQNRIGTE